MPGGGREIMKTCICHALVTGSVACMVLTLGADYIGGVWLGDVRTIPSLRLLAISLSPIAVSSALSAISTAIRIGLQKRGDPAVGAVCQADRHRGGPDVFAPPDAGGLRFMCALVVGGASIAEGFAGYQRTVFHTRPCRGAVRK